MIKVSVMHPNEPGARFDHDYSVDEPATDVGMCHISSDSVESFQAGFGPHAEEILDDIPNYTDLAPVMQISEVVVGQP